MAEYIIADKSEIVAIADAIRVKCNTSDKMSLSQIAESISRLGVDNAPAIGFVPGAYNSSGYPINGIFYGTSIPNSLFACHNTDGYPFALENIIWNDIITKVGNYSFRNAKWLTIPELPNSVTNIGQQAFEGCSSLSWAKLPDSLTTIGYQAFASCTGLTSLDVTGKVNFGQNAFNKCTALTGLKLRSNTACTFGTNVFSGTPIISGGTGYIFVPHTLVDTYKAIANLSTVADNIVPLEGYAVIPTTDYDMEYSQSKSISIKLLEYDAMPNVQITSSDETIVSVTNMVTSLNEVTFDVNTLTTEGTATISMIISDNISTYQKEFDVTVYEEIPCLAAVEGVEGAAYGFTLNNNGYYESTNKGIDSSYALCKVNIRNRSGKKVYIDCINNAENNYDYGIVSNLNTALTLSSSADNSANVFKNFKGLSSTNIQTLDYGVVADGSYIYIKFIKDSSSASGNDSLQFKVRFETV